MGRTQAGWMPGATQLRDLALRTPSMWGSPVTPLSAETPALHAWARAAAEAQAAPHLPWPTQAAEDWWAGLAALHQQYAQAGGTGGAQTQTPGLIWLWLTPLTMSTKADVYGAWCLARTLADSPGPKHRSGSGRSADPDSPGNHLAWLRAWPLQPPATAAGDCWAQRQGLAQQHRWWRQLAWRWGASQAPWQASAAGAEPAMCTPGESLTD